MLHGQSEISNNTIEKHYSTCSNQQLEYSAVSQAEGRGIS